MKRFMDNLFNSKTFEKFYGSDESEELRKLKAENAKLKKQVDTDALLITKLRETIKFYKDNYRKAKDAYLKLKGTSL